VRSIKHGGLVGILITAIVGCSTQPTEPLNPPIQRPLTPTMDSIRELFAVLHVDDILGELIAVERSAIDTKFHTVQSKSPCSPTQAQVLDDFIRDSLSLFDEYMSVDQLEHILGIAIHDSFSQQDVDAMVSFYRTKSGQAVVAKAPAAMRAYAKQRLAEREAARNAKGNPGVQDSLPVSSSTFFKPWENPEYSQFYASDIGQYIKARWPAAALRYEKEAEKLIEPMQARARQMSVEYQVKMKAAGSGGESRAPSNQTDTR
jgi:hypothetical protein